MIMRRWVLRSIFNVILISSALVITSLFILQHNQSGQQQQQSKQYFNVESRPQNGRSGDYYNSASVEGDYNNVAEQQAAPPSKFSTINCEINGEYSIECLSYKNTVFFPFDFLAKYFQIYGHFKNENSTFQFEHSNTGHGGGFALNETAAQQHDCDGAFMNFASFNVERRNKVKFVSVANGVPLSIQWDTTHRGYHFATQVAQFGLSYYSKLVGVNRRRQNQAVPVKFQPGTAASNSDCYADLVVDSNYLKFSCKSFDSPVRVPITVDDASLPLLNLTFEFTSTNGALTFELQMDVAQGSSSKPRLKRRLLVHLTYRCQNGVDDVTSRLIAGKSPLFMVEINYSISTCPTLVVSSIYRYFLVDVLKGLHVLPSEAPSLLRKLSHTDLTMASIDGVKLSGTGTIFGAALLQQADREFVLLAADWLVHNQNQGGGWSVPIGRQLLSGDLRLEPGWHDAMAQGQAMSLLVRAYKMTRHLPYAVAALKAVLPFNIPAARNGVVNRLFDKFDWFEEYPTTPGLYVLNGFIYSLIGLYDASTCLNNEKFLLDPSNVDLQGFLGRTRQLFDVGLETLRQTLPLFDTGYGTFYDLRHLSLPGSQPNIARWDYHDAHVRQLHLLAKIDHHVNSSDNIWSKTARRWYGYMKGIRAPHN